jgi:YfiR/HmsC-like
VEGGCRGLGVRRALVLALALAVSLLLMPPERVASQTANPTEVKAAFLYNFAKFVEWPPEATSGTATINVGVWGSDPLGDALRAVVRDKTVNGRGFTVKRPAGMDDLGGLHMLFIGDGEKARVPDILKRIDGLSVLTVSDIDRFCDLGGTITLFVEESHIRFDVRLDTAQRSRLRLSSKLLNLARKVHGAKQGER